MPTPQPPQLLSLPLELRNLVYGFVLQRPSRLRQHLLHNTIILPASSSPSCTSLLLSNHQIHSEALPIFYRTNTFHVPVPPYSPARVTPYLSPFIRTLDISFLHEHYGYWTSNSGLERRMAEMVQHVVGRCPGLRRLTLRLHWEPFPLRYRNVQGVGLVAALGAVVQQRDLDPDGGLRIALMPVPSAWPFATVNGDEASGNAADVERFVRQVAPERTWEWRERPVKDGVERSARLLGREGPEGREQQERA